MLIETHLAFLRQLSFFMAPLKIKTTIRHTCYSWPTEGHVFPARPYLSLCLYLCAHGASCIFSPLLLDPLLGVKSSSLSSSESSKSESPWTIWYRKCLLQFLQSPTTILSPWRWSWRPLEWTFRKELLFQNLNYLIAFRTNYIVPHMLINKNIYDFHGKNYNYSTIFDFSSCFYNILFLVCQPFWMKRKRNFPACNSNQWHITGKTRMSSMHYIRD